MAARAVLRVTELILSSSLLWYSARECGPTVIPSSENVSGHIDGSFNNGSSRILGYGGNLLYSGIVTLIGVLGQPFQ